MNPWKQLLYRPVLVFGATSAGWAAAAAAVDAQWVAIVAAVWAGVGAFVTQHYTVSQKFLDEQQGGGRHSRDA